MNLLHTYTSYDHNYRPERYKICIPDMVQLLCQTLADTLAPLSQVSRFSLLRLPSPSLYHSRRK